MHNYAKKITDKFYGTGVAIVTPFNDDDTIDFTGLEKLINYLIDGGVEYLVSMGTTGESATLNEEERFSVIDFTISIAKKRVPVVGGFGGNNTAEIIRSIQKFSSSRSGDNSIDAILIASPYYNKPSQEGIYQHYLEIDKHVSLPVILYNVPGRTSSNLEAETTVRIARDAQHVIAIKEASGNFVQCMKIIRDKPANFLVISGDDPITLPFISMGMEGVISVVANAYPKIFSDMIRSCLKNNFPEAAPLHYQLLEFTELIFKEGSPAGVKCALKELKICNDKVRLPLWKVSDGLKQQIFKSMEGI
ncbi:MAG: 4-hydroxy-tetrahydrodipicolinate synthase [Chitinophagales bacterium]